jgi:hypothetical protein
MIMCDGASTLSYMPPKFGIYPSNHLPGQGREQTPSSSGYLPPALSELNEQTIVLRQEDIRGGDPAAPELDWSKVDQGEITLRLKDTEGLLDGRVTVSALTLQRVYPALLAVQLNADYLFPVSLRTVVRQIQAYLNLGEVMRPIALDFDTSIAQAAREDEEFFKLEKLAQPPLVPAEERAETKPMAAEPILTPADRPFAPPSRNKPLEEGTKSKPGIAHGSPDSPGQSEYVGEKKTPANRVRLSVREIAQKPLRRIGLERLQEIFMTEDLLDAGEVAKLVAAFPKVKGSLIMLGNGSVMGGDFPEGYSMESALLAPVVMDTVQEFCQRLKSSKCPAFTMFGNPPVSVFVEGNVCILIAHERRGLLPGMLERIGETARALDAMYA